MGELWGVLTRHFPELRAGFFTTLRLVAIAFVIAMVVGTVVAALRVAPNRWLKRLGGIYVEYFRNMPLLVLLTILYLGLPKEVTPSAAIAGALGLGLYTAAYIAETLRSGVFAVGQGQIDASLSIGFTYRQTLQKIVLPQAFRTVIPPLGSLTIAMIKNSAVIGGALAVGDLLHTAREINSLTFKTNEAFFWSAAGYLILTITITIVVRRLEKRLAVRR